MHKILPVATGRSGIEAGDVLLPGKIKSQTYIYIYCIYTVMAKNIGTLDHKYDQRRLWKLICIVNPFDLLLQINHKNLTFHWIIRI